MCKLIEAYVLAVAGWNMKLTGYILVVAFGLLLIAGSDASWVPRPRRPGWPPRPRSPGPRWPRPKSPWQFRNVEPSDLDNGM